MLLYFGDRSGEAAKERGRASRHDYDDEAGITTQGTGKEKGKAKTEKDGWK